MQRARKVLQAASAQLDKLDHRACKDPRELPDSQALLALEVQLVI